MTLGKQLLVLVGSITMTLIIQGCQKQIDKGSESANLNKDNPKINRIASPVKASVTTLSFSNYTWYVKSGTAGPGPNTWNPNNAFVDSLGKLHLKITYNSSTRKWECAEVWTTTSLGFGKYEWFVDCRLDKLDKNVVLGLFNYPTPAIGPDATNEIDIEYAKWGSVKGKPGNFTVWPASLVNGYSYWTTTFGFSLSGTYTTQRFTWSSNSVFFQSLNGWRTDNNNIISTATYSPANPLTYIPQTAEPVHMNLWLFNGQAPSNRTPVEVVIGKFEKY